MVYSITYTEPELLTSRLGELLARIKPVLVQRRNALNSSNTSTIGHRIRLVREARNLTLAELAEATEGRVPIDERTLQLWESSSDQESNLSLVQLRELALLLGISISELVEPSPEAAAVSYLERYVHSHAARGPTSPSPEDLRQLRRAVLERLANKLDL